MTNIQRTSRLSAASAPTGNPRSAAQAQGPEHPSVSGTESPRARSVSNQRTTQWLSDGATPAPLQGQAITTNTGNQIPKRNSMVNEAMNVPATPGAPGIARDVPSRTAGPRQMSIKDRTLLPPAKGSTVASTTDSSKGVTPQSTVAPTLDSPQISALDMPQSSPEIQAIVAASDKTDSGLIQGSAPPRRTWFHRTSPQHMCPHCGHPVSVWRILFGRKQITRAVSRTPMFDRLRGPIKKLPWRE